MKCIALDFDGTLTEKDNKINLEAIWSASMIERMGIQVILVSGRSSQEMFFLAKHTGLSPYVVGENGGTIQTSPSTIKLLASKEKPSMAFEYLSKNLDNVEILDTFPRHTEIVMKRTFDIEAGKKLLEEKNMDVDLVDSKYSFHITEKNINKSTGFKKIIDELGLKANECIAIGDSETDMPLFEMCGYSIAVQNASETVKKTATHVTKFSRGKGTVEALQHIADKFLKINLDDRQH